MRPIRPPFRAQCEPPSFGRNPLSDMPEVVRKIGNQIKEEWSNTSEVVKKCIGRRLAEKMGEQLSKCLSSKNVENFNFSKYFDGFSHDEDSGNPLASFVSGDGAGGNNTKGQSKEM